MPVATTGYAHVRLTVTDVAASRRFYEDVFGLEVAYEVPAGADDATQQAVGFLFGGVIYRLPGGQLLGLRPVAPSGDRFDEDRVGLDHLSFAVDDSTRRSPCWTSSASRTRTSRTSAARASSSCATPTGSRWSCTR